MGHASIALDGVGPKQEDLRDDRGLAQSSDRGRAPVCLSRWHRAQAQLGWRGAQRLAAGCDRRERERLSGDSRHLRGGEGGQEWLERVPQADASPARFSARRTPGATDNTSPRSPRSGGLRPPCSAPARPEHRPAAASQRSLQACIAFLPLQSSWMSKTYLKSDHFNGGGSPASPLFGRTKNFRLTMPRRHLFPASNTPDPEFLDVATSLISVENFLGTLKGSPSGDMIRERAVSSGI